MQRPDSLPAQLFLLAVDPARRRLTGRSGLGYVLRAAALVDLQLSGHLVDDGGRPKATGNPEPPDPVLDPILRQVTADPRRRWSYWVGRDVRPTTAAIREQLVAGRRIEVEPYRILVLLPARRIIVLEPFARDRIVGAIDAALGDGWPVGERTAALATLQQQNDQLNVQQQDIKNKITQLNSMRLAAYGNNPGTGNLRPVACPQVYDGSQGARAAKFACSVIGKPYHWAEAGPFGYDCSGLTLASWATVGYSLPHNALEQKQVTTRVGPNDLHVGDLVFYYGDVHHVVIYVGNGWVVSASTYGVPIGMQKLDMSRWNSAGRPHH